MQSVSVSVHTIPKLVIRFSNGFLHYDKNGTDLNRTKGKFRSTNLGLVDLNVQNGHFRTNIEVILNLKVFKGPF